MKPTTQTNILALTTILSVGCGDKYRSIDSDYEQKPKEGSVPLDDQVNPWQAPKDIGEFPCFITYDIPSEEMWIIEGRTDVGSKDDHYDPSNSPFDQVHCTAISSIAQLYSGFNYWQPTGKKIDLRQRSQLETTLTPIWELGPASELGCESPAPYNVHDGAYPVSQREVFDDILTTTIGNCTFQQAAFYTPAINSALNSYGGWVFTPNSQITGRLFNVVPPGYDRTDMTFPDLSECFNQKPCSE